MKPPRYQALDAIRGFVLLHMIAYHAVWDLVYLFGFHWKWYQSSGAYFWQQFICQTFILLSGFCFPLGRKKLKRGMVVFLGGALISLVTWLFMPGNSVLFGVLTLIGSCMLLMIPLERLLSKCPAIPGLLLGAALFFFTRDINSGFLGIFGERLLTLPRGWYSNYATAYLGFPMPGFRSTDYFSLFPWFFLFVTGYFLHRFCAEKKLLPHLEPSLAKPLEWLGLHSLPLYLLHQPVLYLVLGIFFAE